MHATASVVVAVVLKCLQTVPRAAAAVRPLRRFLPAFAGMRPVLPFGIPVIARKQLSCSVVLFLAFTCASADAVAKSEQSTQYRITTTRLGTPPGMSVDVAAINNSRIVVGRAYSTTSEHTVPFLWTPDDGFVTFLGDTEGVATSINNRNAIVGHLFRGEQLAGFLWTARDGMVELGTFLPTDLNDHGQIAGLCSDGFQAFGACLWERGVVTEVNDGFPTAINDRGEIVGQIGDTAFIWSRRTGTRTLPGPGETTAGDINNRGDVAGAVCPCVGDPEFHAARWNPRRRLAGVIPAFSVTRAINAAGTIVGFYHSAPLETRAFVSPTADVSIDLGIGEAEAINDRGDIAGITWDANADVVELVFWRLVARRKDRDDKGDDQ
jgi:uncharacterized membrane protein